MENGITNTVATSKEENSTVKSNNETKQKLVLTTPKASKISSYKRYRMPTILVAMILMALMSYIITSNPELAERYPAIFWIATAYVKCVEILARVAKLVFQFFGELIDVSKGQVGHFGEKTVQNWKSFVEAVQSLISYVVNN